MDESLLIYKCMIYNLFKEKKMYYIDKRRKRKYMYLFRSMLPFITKIVVIYGRKKITLYID